jgi:hypothetical protein
VAAMKKSSDFDDTQEQDNNIGEYMHMI